MDVVNKETIQWDMDALNVKEMVLVSQDVRN